jgi:hypothetical protein
VQVPESRFSSIILLIKLIWVRWIWIMEPLDMFLLGWVNGHYYFTGKSNKNQ